MSVKLNWRGKETAAAIAERAAAALTEIDLRIETAAKAELYPGHGKRTGNLQRGIQGEPGRVEAGRVRGSVGVKSVRYALRIHTRYHYITNALDQVRPQALSILSKHVKGK